jgi:hypothetical protein
MIWWYHGVITYSLEGVTMKKEEAQEAGQKVSTFT